MAQPLTIDNTGTPGLSRPMEAILRAGIRAPSGYNNQPWKFSMPGPDTIDVLADWSRRRKVVDPDARELFLSIGAVAENIAVAASHQELKATIEPLGTPGDETGVRIKLVPDGTPDSISLQAIRARRCNRTFFDGQSIVPSRFSILSALQPEPGVTFQFAKPMSCERALAEIFLHAHEKQHTQFGFMDEFIKWSRHSARQAERSTDGFLPGSSSVPQMRPGAARKFIRQFSTPDRQAISEMAAIRSASHLAVISVASDDRNHWIRAGRTMERLLLTAAQLNLATAIHNTPCQVAKTRTELGKALGTGSGVPVALVRLGYGSPVSGSSRRPLREFLAG